MKGWEAIKALEEGKKVRRNTWPICDYIQCIKGGIYNQNRDSEPWPCIDFLFSNDWEIYTEPVTFEQAIAHMENGGKAKRANGKGVVYLKDEHFLCNLNSFEIAYMFRLEDIKATDWELL